MTEAQEALMVTLHNLAWASLGGLVGWHVRTAIYELRRRRHDTRGDR